MTTIARPNPADEVRQASGTRSNDYWFNLFAVNNGGRLFPKPPEHRSHFVIHVMNFGYAAVLHGGVNTGVPSRKYPEYTHGTRLAHLRGRSGFDRYGQVLSRIRDSGKDSACDRRPAWIYARCTTG